MTIKKYFSRQAGFTMTELLVVMFIISLLSASVLFNYRSNKRNYALSQASHQLVSNLRRVQNMAISGVDTSGYDSYGIHILNDAISYILYIDDNNNNSYQPSDTILETINFSDNVKINSTSPLSSNLDVFFRSPDPTTYVNGDNSVGVIGTVTLNVQGLSEIKTITVTTAGLIQGD